MNENLEHLNGKPEDRIKLPEDQEYLGGTGFTCWCSDNKEYPRVTLQTIFPEINNIVFYAGQNNEMMRITPEGFFWKGKLVENDKEIYQKFKEFLNKTNE